MMYTSWTERTAHAVVETTYSAPTRAAKARVHRKWLFAWLSVPLLAVLSLEAMAQVEILESGIERGDMSRAETLIASIDMTSAVKSTMTPRAAVFFLHGGCSNHRKRRSL